MIKSSSYLLKVLSLLAKGYYEKSKSRAHKDKHEKAIEILKPIRESNLEHVLNDSDLCSIMGMYTEFKANLFSDIKTYLNKKAPKIEKSPRNKPIIVPLFLIIRNPLMI